MIKDAASRALGRVGKLRPFVLEPPHTVRLRVPSPAMADGAEILPGAKRLDGVTLEYRGKDGEETWKAILAMMMLAWVATGG